MDPTGKGMRNTFGSTYGREELPIKTYKSVIDTTDDGKVSITKEDITNIDDFSTAITPNLSYGADFRTLYFYEANNKTSSLFQMQGDLYLNFRLNRQFLLYVDKELYSGSKFSGWQKFYRWTATLKSANLFRRTARRSTTTRHLSAEDRTSPSTQLSPFILRDWCSENSAARNKQESKQGSRRASSRCKSVCLMVIRIPEPAEPMRRNSKLFPSAETRQFKPNLST